jgi:DtxR family Mn-dependent transcriptional regulator
VEELAVSAASVSEMLGKLAALELVTHDPYHGARLTEAGRTIAVEIVRHHRLLETYLVQALGYSWDEVHQEADRLEHAISEQFEERMWEALGRPAFDPHGDPIPGPDGRLEALTAQSLHLATAGASVVVSRISDRDPEKLRAIERLGITPGHRIRIIHESQWEGPVVVEVHGADVAVPLGLARAIFTRMANG